MTVAGYASPTDALAAIADCLDGFCPNIHVGGLGSGFTLECCPGCLLRIESAGMRPAAGPFTLGKKGCVEMIADISVTYRTCFSLTTAQGTARSKEQIAADSVALTTSWWEVIALLRCCSPLNQLVRFGQVLANEPDANCAGWTLTLEANVNFCDPCT